MVCVLQSRCRHTVAHTDKDYKCIHLKSRHLNGIETLEIIRLCACSHTDLQDRNWKALVIKSTRKGCDSSWKRWKKLLFRTRTSTNNQLRVTTWPFKIGDRSAIFFQYLCCFSFSERFKSPGWKLRLQPVACKTLSHIVHYLLRSIHDLGLCQPRLLCQRWITFDPPNKSLLCSPLTQFQQGHTE